MFETSARDSEDKAMRRLGQSTRLFQCEDIIVNC